MSNRAIDSLRQLNSSGAMTAAEFAAVFGITYKSGVSRLSILLEKGLVLKQKAKKTQATRQGGRGRFAEYVYTLSAKGSRMARAAAGID